MRKLAFTVATAGIVAIAIYELAPAVIGLGLLYVIKLHLDCLTTGCS
jgi:hypothetical protein